MFSPWADFDRAFFGLDTVRRRRDDGFLALPPAQDGPRAAWSDEGAHLAITLEVPGFAEKDLKVDVNREVVTITGERTAPLAEGYRALRRERGTLAFKRSYSLPVPVATDAVAAILKDGVLSLTLPKLAEVHARSIPVTVATA
jgi:HSP20 family protein